MNDKSAKKRFIGIYLLNCLRRMRNDMGMECGIVNSPGCTVPDTQEGNHQPCKRTDHRARIATQRHANQRTDDSCGQRQNIGQIGRTPDAPGRHRDRHPIANADFGIIDNPVVPGAATEHLRQLLPAAAALFVATPTTALLYLDQGNSIQ
jgi:hypothetical protein